MGKIIKNGIDYSPTIHMPANTATQAGAVAAGGSNYNKVWGTDSQGNPGWIDYSGGSGGHTIVNDSGTDLTQRDNLQFKGVYTEDDSTNGITKVDICRTMTKAQMEALSGEALKGFINTSDEPDSLPLTTDWVETDNGDNLTDRISDIEDGIYNNSLSIGRQRSDIIDDSEFDSLTVNTNIICWVRNTATNAPFNQIWATISTIGKADGSVKNQTFICQNGIAFRHFEANAWSTWTKAIFS